jgi:hypothetical protein
MSDELKQCDSYLRVNEGVVRCQLEQGHKGEHSCSWDWKDSCPVENASPYLNAQGQAGFGASDPTTMRYGWRKT